MAADKSVTEGFHRILTDAVGPEQATTILRRAIQRIVDIEALEVERERRIRGPMAECVAAIEAQFDVVDDSVRELLECLGPGSLRLVTRIVPGCSTKSSLWQALHMVGDTVVEGRLDGARRVLRSLLERRFGTLLDERWLLAIEVADSTELNVCFKRLEDAASIEDVLGRLIEYRRSSRDRKSVV